MKDYTINKKDEHDFILSYEITDDNKIIIEYASGRLYETVYTKELEKDILNKMKNQVLNAKRFKKNQKTRLKINLFIAISFIVLAIILMKNISILSGITILTTGVVVGISKTLIDIPIKKAIKDYEKNLLYVENMELFQNGISKDMGMYLDLNKQSKQTLHTLVNKKEEQENLSEEDSILKEPTINTIDSIAPKAIDDIYDLLTRNEEFSKYYDKSKIKKRTLKK